MSVGICDCSSNMRRETQRADRETDEMRDEPAQKEPHAASGDVVHAEHRENQHAGQQVEAHRDDPQAAEHRIDHQIAAFATVRNVPRKCRAIREMGPEKAVKDEQRPQPEACMLLMEHRRNAEKTEAKADHAQAIDAPGETLSFACISIRAQRCSRCRR